MREIRDRSRLIAVGLRVLRVDLESVSASISCFTSPLLTHSRQHLGCGAGGLRLDRSANEQRISVNKRDKGKLYEIYMKSRNLWWAKRLVLRVNLWSVCTLVGSVTSSLCFAFWGLCDFLNANH